MILRISACASIAAALYVAAPAVSFAADSVVNIKLEDQTDNMDDMKMVLDRSVVQAGKVTLRATNESKSVVHEVIVLKDDGKPLPYSDSTGRVAEKQVKSLGEVSDMKAGQTHEKTFTLAPGRYLLICNQPMHLKQGMYARLTVVAGNPAAANVKADNAPPATAPAAAGASGEDDDDAS